MTVKLIVLPSPEEAAARAAEIVADAVTARPDVVLGLPAGNTPRPIYAELARRHRASGAPPRLSFAAVTAFNLDEYVGLPSDHEATFRRALDEQLYRHVDLAPERARTPEVRRHDLEAAAADYEDEIAAAGGMDLAVLGIGTNGHIAFNEPGSPFTSRTRVVHLGAETRAANQATFGASPVPTRAITIGIATILSARRCLLVAWGPSKAGAVADLLTPPAAPERPASALQLHPDATVVLDRAAASRIGPAAAFVSIS